MADVQMVKVCPQCGMENSHLSRRCVHDALDISNVRPTRPCSGSPSIAAQDDDRGRASAPSGETRRVQQTEDQEEPACVLELVADPTSRFPVREGQTVGRGPEADVVLDEVPNADYISRAHCRFLRRGEQWFVQHLGSTNFIKVDDEKYTDDAEVAVQHGTVLVLSLTAFRVEVNTATDATHGLRTE